MHFNNWPEIVVHPCTKNPIWRPWIKRVWRVCYAASEKTPTAPNARNHSVRKCRVSSTAGRGVFDQSFSRAGWFHRGSFLWLVGRRTPVAAGGGWNKEEGGVKPPNPHGNERRKWIPMTDVVKPFRSKGGYDRLLVWKRFGPPRRADGTVRVEKKKE